MVPPFVRDTVNTFIYDMDKKRHLFGKLLLKKMLIEIGYPKNILTQIKFDINNRPFINNKTDFNISHSGDYVICAISNQSKVGIDIEEIKDINIHEMKNLIFNNKEIEKIDATKTPLILFYEIWTLKEAALKANGNGLKNSMKDIEIYANKIICENELWNFHKLHIDRNYISHIVFKREDTITLNEINYPELF